METVNSQARVFPILAAIVTKTRTILEGYFKQRGRNALSHAGDGVWSGEMFRFETPYRRADALTRVFGLLAGISLLACSRHTNPERVIPSRMSRSLKGRTIGSTVPSRLADDAGGAVAVTFGITAMVVILIVGGSLDYGRAYAMRTVMQHYSDAASLEGSTKDTTGAETRLEVYRTLLPDRIARYNGNQTQVSALWRNETDYEVTAIAQMQTSFLRAMSSTLASLQVSTRSVARGYRMKVVAGPPSKIDLSYEAADYNQVWAYCYDPDWSTNGTRVSDEGTKNQTFSGSLAFVSTLATQENRYGRSDFALIADNGASSITLAMPTCQEGETVSYMLYNSRGNRTNPSRWSRNYTTCGTTLSQTGKSCYTWYTDAKPDAGGLEKHSGTSPYQLETVLCDDSLCAQPRDSATIPGNNDRNRIPQVAKPCQAGKYMYFGWEDRPPQNQGGNGTGNPYAVGVADPGGDRDYDDIRLIMSCPVTSKDTLEVRLIE